VHEQTPEQEDAQHGQREADVGDDVRWHRPFTGSLPSPRPGSSALLERTKRLYPPPKSR
jgi:hypothetical protein